MPSQLNQFQRSQYLHWTIQAPLSILEDNPPHWYSHQMR